MRTSILRRVARGVTTCVVSAASLLPVVSAQEPIPPAPALTPPIVKPPAAAQVTKPLASRQPAPGEHVLHIAQQRTKLSVVALQSRILELPNRIKLVLDFNEETIEVTALNSNQVRVYAKAPGATTVTLIDEFDNAFTVEVFVEADVRELQAYMDRLFPDSAVEVLALRDSVVLRGWVAEPARIPQMIAVARQFYPTVHNQMQVGGVTQVQLHVKVLEVQRSKLERMGVNWLGLGNNFFIHSAPGQLAPLASATTPIGGPPAVGLNGTGIANSAMQFAVTGSSGFFHAFIDVLRSENLAKILAEPVLVTTSGRPASLLSGGEFPVLVPGSVGTTTIQFREFGIRMEVVPIVLGNGRLQLDVSPEVSQRDVQNAVQVNGFTVPGLVTRRVNTQVEMRFGETFMIGGLISQQKTNVSNKIPFLGELPWVGAAFRRTQAEWGETELLILVTPHMAAPIQPCQLPNPGLGSNSDHPVTSELYIDGMIEVPYYGPDCPEANCPPGGGCPAPGMISPDAIPPAGPNGPQPLPPPDSYSPIPAGGPQPQPAELTLPPSVEQTSGSEVSANRGKVVPAVGFSNRFKKSTDSSGTAKGDQARSVVPPRKPSAGLIQPGATARYPDSPKP